MQSQHLVFGAGLIGSQLAGVLISQGVDTTVITRQRNRLKLSSGITITDYLGHRKQVSVPYFAEPQASSPQQYDVVWLTVKCLDVTAATIELADFISPQTTIILCQNGIGSDQHIRSAFPSNTFITAVIAYNVVEQESGHFHRATEGHLILEIGNKATAIANQLHCDLLPIKISQDIVAEQWAKLQLNLSNPINALANIPIKAMTEDSGFRQIMTMLMKELLTVTRAMELSLPQLTAVPAKWIPRVLTLPNWAFMIVARQTLAIDENAKTSMCHDLRNDRLTEIDFINGAVVQQAEKLGIECPYNQRMVHLIHAAESEDDTRTYNAAELAENLY